jgi:uncharacterized Zn finger protein
MAEIAAVGDHSADVIAETGVSKQVVALNATTSLRVVRPRLQEMQVGEFATMRQREYREMDVWPARQEL